MGEILKKPYEISIWDDELVTLNNNQTYYKERKIAIIGTDTMTAPSKVFSPVLTLNINGEKTLTFSLQYKYFDETKGDFINNNFANLLVNERKIKLHYNDQWYDFIIKEREESSEEYTYNYTAIDSFTNELARQGYNIKLDNELNNNQGTATELAEQVLKNTDWIVDKDNSDILQQYVAEPLYRCTANKAFQVLNTATNQVESISKDEVLYVFYSYINNKNGEFVQFLRYNDYLTWHIDDHNIIKGKNYRIQEVVTYDTTNNIISGDTVEIKINAPFYDNQGYRLVYKQKMLYDPVMEEYVDVYKAQFYGESQDIYHYKSYEYGASAIVQSYVTNGTNFSINDSGVVSGWDGMVDTTTSTLPTLRFANSIGGVTPTATQIHNAKSFLRVKFAAAGYNFKNGVHNTGFYDMGSLITNGISRGEKYAIRLRYGVGGENSEVPNAIANGSITAVVAFYTLTTKVVDGKSYSLKTFQNSDVIFNFNTINTTANNKIENGYFDNRNNPTIYYVDNVSQAPSLDYCYYDSRDVNKTAYIWNPDQGYNGNFIPLDVNKFYQYKMGTANALKTLSVADLTNETRRIGIFLYTSDPSKAYYFQNVEIFKAIKDSNSSNSYVLPNNSPEGYVNEYDNFYWKPYGEITKAEINTYNNLAGLAADFGVNINNIIKVYNENCEKVLSISESKSNCYNILQSICETFECWLKISVEHEPNGAVKLNSDFKPIKKIAFKEYVGKDNYAGFKYGINLNTIQRQVDSNEFVSKLVVEETNSDYVDNGIVSISHADANPSGESIIYDFTYYIDNGLITNANQYQQDIMTLNNKLFPLNSRYRQIDIETAQLQLAYEKAKSIYSANLSTLEHTQQDLAARQESFKAAIETDLTYEDYVLKNGTDAVGLDSSEVADIIAGIVSDNMTLSSINGILTNAKKEYKEKKLQLEGAQEYGITVSTSNPSPGTWTTRIVVSDYVAGIGFILDGTGLERKSFMTTLQEKEFEVTSIDPYQTITINQVPKSADEEENYQIQYVQDNKTCIASTDSQLYIMNSTSGTGMTRRFKLVPSANYVKKYKGKKRERNEILEQKQKLINDFENKYSHFIQEGTWKADNYIDSNLYYFEALQTSQTSAKPKVSYTFEVSEISEIEDFKNYNFDIGDKTYIEDVDFFGYKIIDTLKTPHQEEVILSQIEWHLDAPEENIITVQNYKTRFEDLFQRVGAAIVAAEFNENAYARAAGAVQADGTLDPRLLAMSLNNIGSANYSMGAGGNIKSTEDGFEFKSLTDPTKMFRINTRGISSSSNGGNLWEDMVTADGISTAALTAGTIDTQKITIMDGDNTAFRWDKKGLSAYGYGEPQEIYAEFTTETGDNPQELGLYIFDEENGKYELTTDTEVVPLVTYYQKINEKTGYDLTTFVRFDKYGIYGIKNGGEYVVTDLDDIKDKAHFGLTWKEFFIRNNYTNGYISISSDNDIQVVQTINNTEIDRIKIGAIVKNESTGEPTKYGIYIKNKNGDKVFETDDNGDLVITGTVHATNGDFAGRIVSKEGLIGGLTIAGEDLYYGIPGTAGSILISSGYSGSNLMGDTSEDTVWTILSGGNFGVTSDGRLYAQDAVISGKISADSGSFKGHIEAESGLFNGNILIGSSLRKYITINAEGTQPIIASSDYIHNSSAGWVINSEGDAMFNNVSVRGSIKTAVFEYSEVQAVGGAFLFRPSSTIKTARIEGDDVVVTVEQPSLFKLSEWVKLSSYKGDASSPEAADGGLTTVYKIGSIINDEITLLNAGTIFNSPEQQDDEDIPQYDEETSEYIIPAEEGDPTQFEADTYEVDWDDDLESDKQYYINHNYQQYVKNSISDTITFYEYTNETETVYFYSHIISEPQDIYIEFEVLADDNPQELGLYTYDEENEEYVLTTDTEVVPEVTYYQKTETEAVIQQEVIHLENNNYYYIDGDGNKCYDNDDGEPLTISDLDKDESDNLITDEILINRERSVIEKEAIYIGNLALLNASFYNTGENFLIVTYGEHDTHIISSVPLEIFKLEPYVEVKNNIADVVGGALISFGYAEDTYVPFSPIEGTNPKEFGLYEEVGEDEYELTQDTVINPAKTYYKEVYQGGKNNYGIGINSSDNYVGLPARAISLFESNIHPDDSIKVTYNMRAILGTLPPTFEGVDSTVYQYMQNTQGIYTNNMYIGDENQYLAFYIDENTNNRKLLVNGDIVAKSLTISNGSDSYNGVAAINISGYDIEIIADSTGVVDTTNTTYLYPYLYHNGIKVEEYSLSTDTTVNNSKTYYTRSGSAGSYTYTVVSNPSGNPSTNLYYEKQIDYSKFIWYQDDIEPGTEGDINNQGRYLATYGHNYRVIYDFDDGAVGEGEVIQTRTVDPSKYITKINDTGITIHPEFWDNQSSYIKLDGTGMELFDSNDDSIAYYGNTIRVGKTSSGNVSISSSTIDIKDKTTTLASFGINGVQIGLDNESHLEMDYHSMRFIDKERNPYLHISDLRNKNDDWKATLTETFLCNGTERYFYVHVTPSDAVSATDSSDSTNTATRNGTQYVFDHAPASGATVTIVYKTASQDIKAYTLGKRVGTPGPYSFSEGYNTEARGGYSHAEGYGSVANGYVSHAEGNNTKAYADSGAHAEGNGSEVHAQSGHAEGTQTKVYALAAHAEGYQTEAHGFFSHTEGTISKALTDYSHAEGFQTTAGSAGHDWGAGAHAEGGYSNAEGTWSHAEGYSTHAFGYASHAEGEYVHADGECCHAEGGSTKAGKNTEVNDDIITYYAHAEGYYTKALADYSHAEGDHSEANEERSHAEGAWTQANGNAAHSEGYFTRANGDNAHAEGFDTIASGENSHTQNGHTVATETNQTSIGRYNAVTRTGSGTTADPYIYTNAGNYAFIIGNGTDDDTASRSNALTVDWQGGVEIAINTSAASGIDHDLYAAIMALSWQSDVIV